MRIIIFMGGCIFGLIMGYFIGAQPETWRANLAEKRAREAELALKRADEEICRVKMIAAEEIVRARGDLPATAEPDVEADAEPPADLSKILIERP